VNSSPATLDICGELVRAIVAEASLAAALQQFTAAAMKHLPGADAAGLTMLATHEFKTSAPTSGLPAAVDALQYEFGGPCLDAILDCAALVQVDDLATETPWPEFAAAAVAHTGVRSMLSCRLYLDADNPFGSLNLYATTPNAFSAEAARTAEQLTTHAAVAIALVAEREKTANLQRALESSRTIGAAMGVLMTRRLVTAEQAFDLLRAASQHSHRKLREIAADVLDTGSLDIAVNGRARRRPAIHQGADA
jgi:GAF domain-containing protein